jgi:hypothetical protein
MNLAKTDIVKAADVRPARPDGTCFYCRQPLGSEHKPDCVIASRTVVLKAQMEVVVSVPRDWTAEQIEFHRNDSSWCGDNLLREMGAWAASDKDHCACATLKMSFVREATAEDQTTLIDLVADD